ncbi:hypothetical protein SCHPADRAFT_893574, partial [Schizopora paradoxa]
NELAKENVDEALDRLQDLLEAYAKLGGKIVIPKDIDIKAEGKKLKTLVYHGDKFFEDFDRVVEKSVDSRLKELDIDRRKHPRSSTASDFLVLMSWLEDFQPASPQEITPQPEAGPSNASK